MAADGKRVTSRFWHSICPAVPNTFGLIGLILGLAGCGGYSPVVFPAVSTPDMLTKIVGNPNFKAIDGNSFSNAVMLYPTRTGTSHHSIPVSDYLLSRTVLAL